MKYFWQKFNQFGEKNSNWKGLKKLICKECNNEFFLKPSKVRKRKFCSRKCFGIWESKYGYFRKGAKYPKWLIKKRIKTLKKNIKIPNKRKLILLYKMYTQKEIGKLFGKCQQTIYKWFKKYNIPVNRKLHHKIAWRPFGNLNPRWNGGSSFEPYSYEFYKKMRPLIFKKCNYTCQICRRKEGNFDVHHIDFNKKNDDINNLILLCDSCHSIVTNKRIIIAISNEGKEELISFDRIIRVELEEER